ncbi:BsuBI/PstI family type II restriction endonuclease [Geotalea uraniireducens]|uniref:BsuBI/PstI family type II restriction endonuclease n=1 Tax=Geotalea uraniireducens TaxID=351604 RepID=UPI00006BC908|nr:BsuBI/PstI family type II restriction endonuclease [Geotalea uraniireducens]
MEREMPMIPLTVAHGKSIQLLPGKHNRLIMKIIDEFGPRFVPGGVVLYVSDTGGKCGYFDKAGLSVLGIKVDIHDKMPDVVIHYPAKNWILLIDTVTGHGTINAVRRKELAERFASSIAGRCYLSVFPTLTDFSRHEIDISWETDVWIAEAPTHMIHFNGDRFLGRY